MTPDAFIFDLFGVVISFDDQIVYRRIAKHCARPDRAWRDLDGLVSSPELITGVLTLRDMHERLRQAHGMSLTLDEFDALWREPYSESMVGMDDVLETLGMNHRPRCCCRTSMPITGPRSNLATPNWSASITSCSRVSSASPSRTSGSLLAQPRSRCQPFQLLLRR